MDTFPHAFQSPKIAEDTRLYMAPMDSMFSKPWFSRADGLRSLVKRFQKGFRVGPYFSEIDASFGLKWYADSGSLDSPTS
jgi:hypothetical protein